MGDSEEEIDYMSADFLAQCTGSNDIRPGLVHSHAAKRKINMEKKKKEKDSKHKISFRSVKEVQKERLEEGLNTALNSSNKGFSLLQKMGYKPGTSLGKEGQGRLEPVSVDLKQDRVGLGWQQMIADYKKKKEERKLKKKTENVVDPEEYRARKRNERQEKSLWHDLRKSQRICYEMDSKQNITEPEETWFWPIYMQEHEEEEFEEDEEELDIDFEPQEKLMILTSYLRTQYLYCLWCGTVFDDERDLKQNCPGPTRGDHDDDD
ncbi:G patch domain-containing protein 11 [Macrobrachium rosenbergii]|uniref:G patch domain-containing protein 11 n=1 Tax=Macrobrachium rosenbergii TaxID=79674 RepID=UPI0034D5F6E4